MTVQQTSTEAIRDLEIQIERHRDQLRVLANEKNDALIEAERANAAKAEAEDKATEANRKLDRAITEGREYAIQLEDAQTRASHAEAKEQAAVEAASEAKGNLVAERQLVNDLKAQVDGLTVERDRLQGQVAEAAPTLEAIRALNLNLNV